jgi:hypothetical protein
MLRMDELMEAKMTAFLAGGPTHEPPITPLLKAGAPRQVILATAEALGGDLLVIGAHTKRSFLAGRLGGTARKPRCALCRRDGPAGGQRPLMQTSEVGDLFPDPALG